MAASMRSFLALLRRNAIYRKRRWLSSIFEFSLPVISLAILLGIKRGVENGGGLAPEVKEPTFPSDYDVVIPFSFADYITALQTEKRCIVDNITKSITGMSPYDWPVPLIKCDSRKCKQTGEDAMAMKYCENFILVVATKTKDDTVAEGRVDAFMEYIERMYPQLYERVAIKGFDYDVVHKFDDAASIDRYIASTNYGKESYPKMAGAIIFDGAQEGVEQYEYAYTLRVNSTNFNNPENEGRPAQRTMPETSRVFQSFSKNERDACSLAGGTSFIGAAYSSCTKQYVVNGALPLQRLVNDFIMDQTGAADIMNVARNGVRFSTFPTKEYTEQGFFSQISAFAPLLVALGMLYPVAACTRAIVQEKELRQKELMLMMSVPEAAIGWSWFVSLMSFFLVSAILTAYTSSTLYGQSSFTILLLFWILVIMASILFSFVIAAVFSKSTRATLVAMLMYFVGYFLTLAVDYQNGSPSALSAIGIHPVAAFSYGLQIIGNLEEKGVGLTGNTVLFADYPSGFMFQNVLGSLMFDCVIWGVLSWYLNRVVKGDYGRSLPVYFPFMLSYWCPGRAVPPPDGNENDEEKAEVPIEPVSEALKSRPNSVKIVGMTKQFGEKTAVDGLSLSMYSGQVTALLGHNGAGKTTTIGMLTGMVEPTSGHATISDLDIRTQMPQIRENIGICLQHDCLFPLLTVKEHLQFFARVKGLYSTMSASEAEESITTAIKDVALMEKRNTYSKDLSGGMKRKLSVAIAFCGGSKTVFLDEPTSGMDPFSRRFTWNVIRQYRNDRCIILTTHFMDEADILGDRIAIMGEGRLRCAGSSLFLKRHYGVGYQLVIEKNPPSKSLDGQDIDSETEQEVMDIVKEEVMESTLLSNIGTEISFQLPLNASDRFVNMFDRLDSLVESKKIVTYGVSVTTLDEVFLMVARGDTGHEEVQDSVRKSTMNQNENGLVEEVPDNVSITSKSYKSLADMNETTVFNRHVQALFAKRAMNFKRDKKAWCCSTVCPSVFALIGFLMITFIPVARNMDPLTLTLDDNNPGVKPDERNPIPFNKAGGKYSCQPGSCISWPPSFDSNGTNEKYSYCGWEARINADGSTCSGFSCSAAECSISESGEIVDKITNYGTFLVEEDVSDVKESSEALYNSSSLFAASQYGALYFTHDPTSTIDEMGSTYNNKTVASCEKNSGNYTNPDQCASFSGVGYIVQTNHTAPHASLLYQSVGDEALIRAAKGDTMGRYKIIPTIHPLPITSVEDSYLKAEQAFTPWFLMVLSLPFITGAFATFIVAERQSKAKHLQTVAGVKPAAYWFSSYLWDIMNYQLPLWIIVILMFAFDVELFTTTERGVLGGTIMSLFLFGPAAAGFTYCFSFLFKSPSLCNLSVIVFNFLIGMAGPLVTFILRLIGADPTLENAQKFVNIAIAVEWVLRFFPMFNMSKALFYIINIQILVGLTGNSDLSVWSSDVCLIEVLYLAAQSILYILLAIQIDKWSTKPKAVQMWRQFVDVITCGYLRRHASRLFGKGSRHNEREVVLADSPDDEDVAAEKQRVLDGEADSDPIVLKELSKQYANGKLAVNGLSFGIPSGTCFGLLGINGAGKTTTMAMLTAEFPPSKGDAVLAGYSVKNEPEQTRKRIGYCPQFDAHFMNMTGKEHVELYASIKGVPKEVIKDAVSAKLAEVGLSEFDSQRLSAGYSGGMKRKLSVACATIGQPQIVFLDEPSTGMDPVARRDLWKVISRMVVGGPDEDPLDKTSLILTTHSMEECEALCPLIGIMAGGRLRCLGSAQRLKSRFGEGFQVETKCKGVTPEDSDYQSILSQLQQELGKSPDGDEEITSIFIKLDQVLEAVKALTGDEFLSSMITEDNPIGYVIHKEASSDVGINLNELAAFCVEELRVKAVIDFFGGTYPGSVLRERQDNKVRYEVGSVGLKISSLFSTIEENKSKLQLSDYGVSQTSLEQVFNMFAAEAEERKQNTVD